MVTLAQALNVKITISKRIQVLADQLISLVNFTVPKEEATTFDKTPNLEKYIATNDELSQLRRDYLVVMNAVTKANVESFVSVSGVEMSILEAIERAKQLRAEASFNQRLSTTRPISYNSYRGETAELMILDSENCKVTAETCTKFADSISLLVEGKNHQIMIDLPVAEKYLSI